MRNLIKLLLTLPALAFAACAQAPVRVATDPCPMRIDHVPTGILKVTIRPTPARVRVGEAVVLDLLVENVGSYGNEADIAVFAGILGFSPHGLDIEIIGPDGKVRPYSGVEYETGYRSARVALAPGYRWGRSVRLDRDYAFSAPGSYTIRALLRLGREEIVSNDSTLQVE